MPRETAAHPLDHQPGASLREDGAPTHADGPLEADFELAKRRPWLLIGIYAVLLLLLGCLGFLLVGRSAAPTATPHLRVHTKDEGAPRRVVLTQAIGRSQASLHQALGLSAPEAPAFLREAAATLARRGHAASAADALAALRPSARDCATERLRLQLALAMGQHELVQHDSRRLARTCGDADRRLAQLYYASFADDPSFDFARPVRLESLDLDALELLGSGTSLVYRARRGEEPVAAFKPEQTLWFANYRGEIAAYRLCVLLDCGIDIPRNRWARVGQAPFAALLLGPYRELTQKAHSELLWSDSTPPLLDGTLKDWVRDFVHFPIGDTELWAELLRQDVPLTPYRALSAAEAMPALWRRHPANAEAILRHAEGVSAIALATQISNLHVLDVLLDNWDRRGPGNCQWARGRLLSIDNGASFPVAAQATTEPQMRVKWRVERFSRSLVAQLRWLDPVELFAHSWGPAPWTADELDRLEQFVHRRNWLLARVDELSARYGEDAVLSLP